MEGDVFRRRTPKDNYGELRHWIVLEYETVDVTVFGGEPDAKCGGHSASHIVAASGERDAIERVADSLPTPAFFSAFQVPPNLPIVTARVVTSSTANEISAEALPSTKGDS